MRRASCFPPPMPSASPRSRRASTFPFRLFRYATHRPTFPRPRDDLSASGQRGGLAQLGPTVRLTRSGGIPNQANVAGDFGNKCDFLDGCFICSGTRRQIADLGEDSFLGLGQFFTIGLSRSVPAVFLENAKARRIRICNHFAIWTSTGGVQIPVAEF